MHAPNTAARARSAARTSPYFVPPAICGALAPLGARGASARQACACGSAGGWCLHALSISNDIARTARIDGVSHWGPRFAIAERTGSKASELEQGFELGGADEV